MSPTPTSFPTRTGSLRKPSTITTTDTRTRSNGTTTTTTTTTKPKMGPPPLPRTRTMGSEMSGNTSPSKLPMRQPSKSISSSREPATSGLQRTSSIATRSRPLSLVGRPTSSSAASNGSMGPPPRPTSSRTPISSAPSSTEKLVSRPPISGDNYKISTRATTRDRDSIPSAGLTRSNTVRDRESISSTTGLTRSATTRTTRAQSNATSSSSAPSGRGHTRNSASINSLSNAPSLRPPNERLQNPDLNKPVFSTLQQHFSPARNLAPKPTIVSLLAPPSPSKLPSNIAISAETSRLQAQLLQLHLLHRDADAVDKEWRASARHKLGERFEKLVKRNDELIGLEEGQRDRECGLVLKSWAADENSRSGWGLEDRIQVLDECVTGLWSMSEPGSRYGRVVRRFEKWMDRVVDIRAGREKGVLLDDHSGDLLLIEELDQQWRDELRSQARKVETFHERLADLGEVEGKSSLSRTLSGLMSMASGMATELDYMKKIEAEVVRAEAIWIREMIEDAGSEDEGTAAGAVWRTM